MRTDPFELLKSMQRTPISSLVEELRALHSTGRARAAERRRRSVRGRSALGSSASARALSLIPSIFKPPTPSAFVAGPDVSNVVRLLTAVHSATDPASLTGSETYRRVRSRLRDFELGLRRQKSLVEQILSAASPESSSQAGAVTSVSAMFQQTLYLKCPLGGVSSGRFRCRNRSGERADVVVVPRPLLDQSGTPVREASLEVSPRKCDIAAGEELIVKVTLDLGDCRDLDNRTLEGSVDVLMEGRMGLKLWLEVEVDRDC